MSGSSEEPPAIEVRQPEQPTAAADPPRPRLDRLRRAVATILLVGMVAVVIVRPDVSPSVLGTLGTFGLALFGVDVPWVRIVRAVGNSSE